MKLNLKIGSITIEDVKMENLEISEEYSLEEMLGSVKVLKDLIDYIPEGTKKAVEGIKIIAKTSEEVINRHEDSGAKRGNAPWDTKNIHTEQVKDIDD